MDGVTQEKCHALPLRRNRKSAADAELRRRPARVTIPLLPFAAAAPVLVRRYTTLNRSYWSSIACWAVATPSDCDEGN